MIADNSFIPAQLQKGPAVGFLALTDHLVFLRLANTRDCANWQPIENVLKKLYAETRRYLARDDAEQGITQELIIHRDRIRFTLDAWEKRKVDEVTWAITLRQEQYLRRIQCMLKDERE